MTTLSGDVLKGNLLPPEGYMDNYVIEAVEKRLKAQGWDGQQPTASIIVHFESKKVKHVQNCQHSRKE